MKLQSVTFEGAVSVSGMPCIKKRKKSADEVLESFKAQPRGSGWVGTS